MIRRIVASVFIAWMLGFIWFAIALPQPLGDLRTDAIVVPTGGEGRIARGLAMLRDNAASLLLVTGVDEKVRPAEFREEYRASEREMDCCITLGFAAVDTRGNARETREWIADRRVRSVRLVTSDWHMRRAALELENALPPDIAIGRDAVATQPALRTLFVEYHKFLAAWAIQAWPG